MSHTEIWDDSALVNSWNEALEEYKHYYSIHARGEKVEEVIDAFDSEENGPHEIQAMDDSVRQAEILFSNAIKGGRNGEGTTECAKGNGSVGIQVENKLSQAEQALKSKPSEGGSQRGAPPVLQHLIGSGEAELSSHVYRGSVDASITELVHDEGLKSLLMSWYYAGYYTGLYEGQHHGK